MPIRTDDPRPAYVQLAAELREEISSGDYTAGQRLPSTRELAERHGIAPMTVQNALRVLRDEGLVVAHQGRGVFVQVRADDGHGPSEPAEIAAELRSMHDTLRDLDDRLTRIEQLVAAPAPKSAARRRRTGG